MGMNMVRLPNAEEAEMVKKAVKEIFSFADIPYGEIRTEPDGRMLTKATIPSAKRELVFCRLFGYGIVAIDAGNGEWGFAVRA